MKTLRLVFVALAIAILGLLGWRAAAGRVEAVREEPRPIAALEEAMRSPAPAVPDLPQPVATPEDRIAEVPEFASFYARLKADFPHDYDTLLGQLGTAGRPSGANAAIWDAMRDLEQSQGILAAQAGSAALDRFFDARSAMLDGLAPLNARQCVDFLYGMTDPSIADFTAAHRGLVATLADRTLDAIADGRAHPPERSAPTQADLDALSSGLSARGLSPAEVGLLIDGITPDPPLPDARLCDVGRIYLDVLHALPADARQRIYGLAAELLARS